MGLLLNARVRCPRAALRLPWAIVFRPFGADETLGRDFGADKTFSYDFGADQTTLGYHFGTDKLLCYHSAGRIRYNARF